MDNDDNMIYGNLKETTIKEAWNNEQMAEYRKQHLTGDNINYYCKVCPLTKYYQVRK